MKPEFKLFAEAGVPHPCCVPSKQRASVLIESRALAAARITARGGSTEGMVRLDGGRFFMGTDAEDGFPADGEGPIREVRLDAFYIDTQPVTNEQFTEFVRATSYVTEAERFAWSFVFQGHVSSEAIDQRVPGT